MYKFSEQRRRSPVGKSIIGYVKNLNYYYAPKSTNDERSLRGILVNKDIQRLLHN